MKKKFYDYCGFYRIVEHRNGTATVYHKLIYGYGRVKVGDYKSVNAAKRGLSKYCGGMPTPLDKNQLGGKL